MGAKLKLDVADLKFDPENILGRLYDAASMALHDINIPGITQKERLAQMTTVARICVTLNALNKGQNDVPIEYGSQVRQYEKLFTTKNAAGGRVVRARPRPKSKLLEPLESLDLDDSDAGVLEDDGD